MAPTQPLSVPQADALYIESMVLSNETNSRNRMINGTEDIAILDLSSSVNDHKVVDAAIEKAIQSAATSTRAINAAHLKKRSNVKRSMSNNDDDTSSSSSDEDEIIVAPPGVDLSRLILMHSKEDIEAAALEDFKRNWQLVGELMTELDELAPDVRESIFRPIMIMLRKRVVGGILLGAAALVVGPVLGVKLSKDHKIEAMPAPKNGFIITNPDGGRQEIKV